MLTYREWVNCYPAHEWARVKGSGYIACHKCGATLYKPLAA